MTIDRPVLYHSPATRSSAVLALVEEMGIRDRIDLRVVEIRRHDGSGRHDPANPHPEGKVPYLLHNGHAAWERAAIMTYLTELFPEAGLAPRPGDADRGTFLSWMAYYGAVMEPVLIMAAAGLSHDWMHAALRGVPELNARLEAALADGRPWLLGERFSAADILMASPYGWFRDATPDVPVIRDWVARCLSRPALVRVAAEDTGRLAA